MRSRSEHTLLYIVTQCHTYIYMHFVGGLGPAWTVSARFGCWHACYPHESTKTDEPSPERVCSVLACTRTPLSPLAVCRLSKAGALHKDTAANLSYTSAWAELLGYAASLYLSLLKLQSLTQQEGALLLQLAAARGGRRSSNSSGDRAGCGISTMAVEQQVQNLSGICSCGSVEKKLRVCMVWWKHGCS